MNLENEVIFLSFNASQKRNVFEEFLENEVSEGNKTSIWNYKILRIDYPMHIKTTQQRLKFPTIA